MSRRRGTAAFLGLAGALVALLATARPLQAQASNSLAGSPFERAATADSLATAKAGDSLSSTAATGSQAATDSVLVKSAADSAKVRGDSTAATRQRSLPPRTLTLRQQVMFAGGFMAFIALMMASMQNFNP